MHSFLNLGIEMYQCPNFLHHRASDFTCTSDFTYTAFVGPPKSQVNLLDTSAILTILACFTLQCFTHLWVGDVSP